MTEFIVQNVLENGGRTGTFKRWSGKEVNFQTPMCFIHTQAGHVPHLAHDLLPFAGVDVDRFVFQLTLPSFIHRLESVTKFGRGLSSYFGYKNNVATFLSIHDPAEKMTTGYNTKNSISLCGVGGRYNVDLKIILDVIGLMENGCVQVIADTDLGIEATPKRIIKALERSKKFLEGTKQSIDEGGKTIPLFGTITGGFDEEARCQSATDVTGHNISGYVIEGLHTFGPLDSFDLDTLKPLCRKFSKRLDSTKPIACFGAYNPQKVLDLVQSLNADIFDTSYATVLTESHKYLSIDYEKFDGDKKWFSTAEIANKNFSKDFSKLVATCDCYTCQNYSKSYLYHLNQTSELLEYILLMIHNLHQYTTYFDFLRRHLSEGKESEPRDS